jgi:DNA invertase Pin-like site-specific DNA recombinase
MYTNDASHKITTAHLKRDAFLYVRQSSLRQVLENTESTKRQYALRERAVALGWSIDRIHVIDNDLGQSGAQATNRDGFQHLVTEVALGKAGIILGLEVSRLARNNADWHRLLELAALAGTLILDEDGIYDPSHFNDRLLLGLKGAMSEAELHVLKARLQGGIRNKARRGELKISLPIGLIYQDDNLKVGLETNQQIQNSIRFVFETFAQTGSAMAVVRRFNNEHLLFPRRIRRGIGKGDIQWGTISHSRVLQILHNPSYAGAFVYGRSRSGRTADLQPTTIKVAREDWQVLIQNTHVGYISWEEFERNQVKLNSNALSLSFLSRGSVPREGSALLQGRIICGICGTRMRVRYDTTVNNTLSPYYVCEEAAVRNASKVCQSVRGSCIDSTISSLIQETVTPDAIEMAFAVQHEIASRIKQADDLRCQQFESASYDAELARRRYVKVDPDNRLVADVLEAEWNNKLRILNQLQQEHEQQRKADTHSLNSKSAVQIDSLVKDFSGIWNDPCIPSIERKQMIAYLIEDVTVIKADKITLHIRFKGGKTQSLSIERPIPIAKIRKTRPEVIEFLDILLNNCTDLEAATELNKKGYKNWKGESFTYKKVVSIRLAYGLKSSFERLRDRGFLTADEVAIKLGIAATTVHVLGREGLIPHQFYANNKRCLYNIPSNTTFIKGRGGKGATKPKFITSQSSLQDAI